MRLLTIGLLALTLTLPAGLVSASQKELRIAAGRLGGTYRDVYGPNLGKLLYGYKPMQINTSGSGENLDRLADQRADIGFAQADVFAARLAANPERYGQLKVLGRVADECLYLAVRTDGPVKTLEQLASAPSPTRISIGQPGGGAAGTWGYLKTLMPGLATVEANHEEGTLALNRLAIGAADGVLWVTDPANLEHFSLQTVIDNQALDLAPLTDPALVSTLPDGTHVYQAREVKLSGKRRAPSLPTVCTSALLVMRKDAEPRLIEKVSNVLGLELDKIVTKP